MTETPQPSPEDAIPDLALQAFREAFLRAASSGEHIVIADDGMLVEVLPDGTRRRIKPLPPNIAVAPGTVIALP